MALHTFSIPGFPVLRGRRVRLRAPHADDAAALFALFSDAETMAYWPRAPMQHVDEAAGYIAECGAFFEQGERIDWVITLPRDDTAIGTCTLYDIDAGSAASIGYALLPAHRGQGLATEAVTLAIAWSVRALGLRHVRAEAEPGNVASQRVLARLGFARVAGADHCFEWTST